MEAGRPMRGVLAVLGLMLAAFALADDVEETLRREAGDATQTALELAPLEAAEHHHLARAAAPPPSADAPNPRDARPARPDFSFEPAPERGERSLICAASSGDEGCRRARRIADLGACVRPELCPAVDAWQALMGPPRIERATRAARADRVPEGRDRDRDDRR